MITACSQHSSDVTECIPGDVSMFSAGQCLHREPSLLSLTGARHHDHLSPRPAHTAPLISRQTNPPFLITFIHNPIQSHFTTWTVDKAIDTHTHTKHTSVSGIFVKLYQTYLVANLNFFQQSLQNTFSYLYEHILYTHFSYSSHWCQTGRAGSGVMTPGLISLTHSNWAEQTPITLATPPQS